MQRYIDADNLIKQIREKEILPHDARKTLEAFLRMNKDELTADVRENIHGRWIEIEPCFRLYECSICGHNLLRKTSNFCPTCGAVMDEGEGK